MKPLSEIPVSRPAATAHSPNRKPRNRNNANQITRRNTLKVKGERVLQAVATGRSRAEAIDLADTTVRGLEILERRDPDFRQKLAEAEEEAALNRARAAGYLDAELLEIAKEYRQIGKEAQDPRLRADVDWKTMRGRGVLTEHQEITGEVPTNPGRVLIVNIIGNPEARQAAITLARIMEGGTSGNGGKAEPGTVEKV